VCPASDALYLREMKGQSTGPSTSPEGHALRVLIEK